MFTTVNTAEKALFDMTNDEIVHAHATAIYNMENSMREDGFESATFAQWQRNVKLTRAMILELTQNIPQTDTEDVLDNYYHNIGRFALIAYFGTVSGRLALDPGNRELIIEHRILGDELQRRMEK